MAGFNPIETLTPIGTQVQMYVLSNGTKVLSATPVMYYTPQELLKIEIAGGLVVIAVLIITYTCIRWYQSLYKQWQRREVLQELIESGEEYNPDDYPEIPAGINKKLLYLGGVIFMFAGAAIYFL